MLNILCMTSDLMTSWDSRRISKRWHNSNWKLENKNRAVPRECWMNLLLNYINIPLKPLFSCMLRAAFSPQINLLLTLMGFNLRWKKPVPNVINTRVKWGSLLWLTMYFRIYSVCVCQILTEKQCVYEDIYTLQ